jgi:hypothetical protein
MSDQIFTKVDNDLPDGAVAHHMHKACSVLDAENPSAYRFNHAQGDIRGTLVPVPSPNGGIKGSKNPFGKIVMGEEVRFVNGRQQSQPFTPTWLADAIPKGNDMSTPQEVPPPPPKAQTDTEAVPFPDLLGYSNPEQEAADANAIALKESSRQEAEAAVARQAEADTELTGLMEQMNKAAAAQAAPPPPQTPAPDPAPAGADMQQMLDMFRGMVAQQRPVTAATEPDGYDSTEIPEVRAKLSGTFGTSRGTYRFMYATDELIILGYGLEANIFTPPASEEHFKLSCNNQEYTVYFLGVEFELPCFECGIQVMIRSE